MHKPKLEKQPANGLELQRSAGFEDGSRMNQSGIDSIASSAHIHAGLGTLLQV